MSNETQSDALQLPLFTTESNGEAIRTPPRELPVAGDASVESAIDTFRKYMQERGFAENTQEAFRRDLVILSDYLGPAATIDDVGTTTLNAFLKWMDSGRGIPCSPKTMERRITTLKVFFGWLAEEGVLPRDVAAPLIHRAVSAPLPTILSAGDIAALMETCQNLRQGTDDSAPDARPLLLLSLVLSTGIKKSECSNIHMNHLDLADPDLPAVWIRYRNAQRRHKERRIRLPSAWPEVLDEYLQQYPTEQKLFRWTPRNLEYVLTGIAEKAEVQRVTFEILRWTCAVHDYVNGMDANALRRKMGLSQISWYEAQNRLEMLSRMPAGRTLVKPA